jgi:hypothetical protein
MRIGTAAPPSQAHSRPIGEFTQGASLLSGIFVAGSMSRMSRPACQGHCDGSRAIKTHRRQWNPLKLIDKQCCGSYAYQSIKTKGRLAS